MLRYYQGCATDRPIDGNWAFRPRSSQSRRTFAMPGRLLKHDTNTHPTEDPPWTCALQWLSKPANPWSSKPCSWRGRNPAKCWSRSRRRASATPITSPSRAPIPKASSRRSWAMKVPASSSMSDPTSRALKKGDHVIPLYTPECRQCEYCLSQKTNLCQAIRTTQGQGLMPDGTSRFSIGWQEDAPLHGHLDLRQFHRGAGDRAGQDPSRRALRQGLLYRLRCDDRHRRRHQHRPRRTRRQCRRVRSGRHRPQRHPGRRGLPVPT